VIEEAYLPTSNEVDAARTTIEQLESEAAGTLADGAFVDAAMLGAAAQVLELAARYGTSGS
jgi:citrate lyase beta subunit